MLRLAPALLLLVACGGAPAAIDAGAGDGATADAALVIAPPAAPMLTPCPAGWREAADTSGATSCDPWPSTGHDETCAFDEAHFPGTPGCARIGTACASDGWPSDLPTGRTIVYVDDDAAGGGDGSSRTSAFRTIAAATMAAPADAVIAIAVGHYDEHVDVHRGQTLWGACVDGTRLSSSAPTFDDGVVYFGEPGAGMRNLGIEPSERLGVWTMAADVTIEDVAMMHTPGGGIWADAGPLTIRNVSIRDTPKFGDQGGNGLQLDGGAHVVVDHVVVESSGQSGISLQTGADVQVSDTLVRTHPARGVYLDAASHAVLERVTIEDVTSIAIHVLEASHLEATDLRITNTHYNPADDNGEAVTAQQASVVTLTRTSVLGWGEYALYAVTPDTTIEVTDGVLAHGAPGPTDPQGNAVFADLGATVRLVRVLVEDAATSAIYANGTESTVEATDLTVRATRSAHTGEAGNGITAFGGAHVTLARTLVDHVRQSAIGAKDPGTLVEATDLVVVDTQPQESDMAIGRALDAVDGARLVVERASLERSRNAGVFLADGARLEATDVSVLDTMADGATGGFGVALWAQDDAAFVLTRVRVERAHFAGVAVVAATLDAHDLHVSEIASADCASTSCPELAGGFGIASHFGGRATVDHFVVSDTALCGVVVGANDPSRTPTALDLADGTVARAPVGACVQVDGYDPERLHVRVTFDSVGVPLQATSYSLPTSL